VEVFAYQINGTGTENEGWHDLLQIRGRYHAVQVSRKAAGQG